VSGTDVEVEQAGAHVGVVRLNRPPNNYFDTELIAGVAEAYEALDRSGWCRAIVLGSEGRHFCAGLDFSANADQDIAALYSAALRLFAAPLPVVAAVQGAAIGGGCGLALSADFRVATAQSRFSANFSRLGFHHGFALSVTLPAAVGRQAAADLLLSGRRVRGEQALALGLCDRLAGEDDLLADAIAYAVWLRRLAWPWSTSTHSRPGCATRPTSPRACAPRQKRATRCSAASERGRARRTRAQHLLQLE
jgi:2-(1,2-epoxy-1,2-dihydrophenyl)acetyl-CoA isomerase